MSTGWRPRSLSPCSDKGSGAGKSMSPQARLFTIFARTQDPLQGGKGKPRFLQSDLFTRIPSVPVFCLNKLIHLLCKWEK